LTGAGLERGLRTGREGSPGRAHIVDEQDMAATQAFRLPRGESAADVSEAILPSERGLARGVADACEG
jgi:hypothetical protein